MSDNAVTLFSQACEFFDGHVRAVGTTQWSAATPCSDWNVHQLVNHVAVEDLWVAPLLAGKMIEDVGDAYEGDQLGDDPVASWSRAVESALTAAQQPGASEQTVHTSAGDFSGAEYLMQIFAEHLIHGWDLAKAIGADTTLPPTLVVACSDWFETVEPLYRKHGALGERPSVPTDADTQTRLLAAYGRIA